MNYSNRLKFDLLTKPFGGRLEIEKFEENYPIKSAYDFPKNCVGSFFSEIELLPSFDYLKNNILYDYIFNPECNALSSKIGKDYVFGVNSGFVDTMLECTLTLFAHKHFFPGLGEVEKEDDLSLKIDKAGFDVCKKIFSHTEDISYHFTGFQQIPKSESRLYYAYMVTELATEFLYFHEFSHIVCGHIDYNMHHKKASDISLIFENNIIFKEQYVLEFDADINALQILTIGEMMYERFNVKGKKNNSVTGIISNNNDLITEGYLRRELQYLLPISVTVIMLLFSQYSNKYVNWKAKNHPHPLVRLVALNYQLQLMFMYNKATSIDDIFIKNWFRAYRHTLCVWEDLKLPGVEMLNALDDQEWDKLSKSVVEMISWTTSNSESPMQIINKIKIREIGNNIIGHFRRKYN